MFWNNHPMAPLTVNESVFFGTVFEWFFYGLYVVIFSLYARLQGKKRTPMFYALCFIFGLCTVFVCMDFTEQYFTLFLAQDRLATVVKLNIVTSVLYSCVDFTSQCVLIYRCWIMWNRNSLLASVLVLLSFASFAISIFLSAVTPLLYNGSAPPSWFYPAGVSGFSISLAMNSIVTGLLVFKLYQHHRDISPTLSATTLVKGTELKPIMAVLVESGMFTFVGQLIYVVLFRLRSNGWNLVSTPLTVIYGITPTLIHVRVARKTSAEFSSISAPSKVIFASRGSATVGFVTTSVDVMNEVATADECEPSQRLGLNL